MNKVKKVLRIILLTFITVILVVVFYTNISNDMYKLTDNQISNILEFIGLITIFNIPIALSSLKFQKNTERKLLYKFQIESNSLSLEKYKRFPTEIKGAYKYEYCRKDEDLERPYYGIEVELQKNALCSVGIPLRMKIITGMFGTNIEISNLTVIAKKDGEIKAKKRKPSQNLIIDTPIKGDSNFLIRIQLICDHQMEEILLDSRIYLNFELIFKEKNNRRKYREHIFLEIQNTMGESRILSISPRNNLLSYTKKLII